jgi:hypothetical protein
MLCGGEPRNVQNHVGKRPDVTFAPRVAYVTEAAKDLTAPL